VGIPEICDAFERCTSLLGRCVEGCTVWCECTMNVAGCLRADLSIGIFVA